LDAPAALLPGVVGRCQGARSFSKTFLDRLVTKPIKLLSLGATSTARIVSGPQGVRDYVYLLCDEHELVVA
jgi:hypothetical protein